MPRREERKDERACGELGLLSAHPRYALDVDCKKELENEAADEALSGEITVVCVLLAAPERQARSQTHFFMVQKKKRGKKRG